MGPLCKWSLSNNKSIKYLTYYIREHKSRYKLMNTTLDPSNPSTHQVAKIQTASPAYQAFRLLHIGFVAAPILAGVDKFFHLLVNWDQYLPAAVARLSPIGGHN